MPQSKRDPKKDPKVGDRLSVDAFEYEVAAIWSGSQELEIACRINGTGLWPISIPKWLDLMKNAEVLYVAD